MSMRAKGWVPRFGKTATAALLLMSGAAAQGQTITNYQVEGDLAGNAPTGCVGLEGIGPQSNPVDLYTGARACLAEGKYENARLLWIAGDVRGRYDWNRVKDRTAHQAVLVVKQGLIGSFSETERAGFQASLQELESPENRLKVCSDIVSLGAPDYFPQYMVAHGMGAFAGRTGSDAVAEPADPQATYVEIARSYLKCAGPDAGDDAVGEAAEN